MAIVALATLWLNDASALSDSQSFPYMSKMAAVPQTPGEVRPYANGRYRAINRAGVQSRHNVTLPACSRMQIAWIEAKAGQLLCIRDDRGRKYYGVYYNPTIDEHPYDTNADVTLSLIEVTHSEAV